MNDLYDSDFVLWSERQAALLRRMGTKARERLSGRQPNRPASSALSNGSLSCAEAAFGSTTSASR